MNRFSICQAYAQLESDYNVGGWLRERPSNQRRRESIGVQLSRIGFSNPHCWVDIEAESNDEDAGYDDEVREVYMHAVLRLNLPITAALMQAMRRYFARLNGRYPCPAVTSDYDCSVIFDAIGKGDA